MSVVITREDIMAYAEIDYIIHHMNKKYIEKVPEKLLQFFSAIKDPKYEVYVDPLVPLQNQNLKRYTLELLALIHLKYWCEDEERKKQLYDRMVENQKKLDEQMRKKYDIDNMFELNSVKVVSSEKDLKEDYSKPKTIVTYNNVEENQDVQDFTDVKEDKISNYLNNGESKINELEKDDLAITKKESFLNSLFSKLKNIFTKK